MFLMPTKPFTTPNFNLLMIKKIIPIALTLALVSCDKKFNDLGAEVFPEMLIQGEKANYPVKVTHSLIDVVQTNAGSILQLGERNDNLYGTMSASVVSQFSLTTYPPRFGSKNAELEISENFDEQETITDVWLEIPFFTNQIDADGDGLIRAYDIDDADPNSDSDADGVSDIVERNNGTDPTNPDTDGDGTLDGDDSETENPNPDKKLYAIDSLFGNREATLDVEVTKLNYFLRQLDPDNNFEQQQPYYSNFNIDTYKDQQLASEQIQLSFDEIVIDGEDAQNLTPRLRVPLDKSFFQHQFFDKEGATEFSTAELFQDYFRSFSIETSNFSSPLLMLLDFDKMVIRVAYTYKSEDTEADPVVIVDEDSEYVINAGFLKFSTINRTTPVSPALQDIVASTAPAKIALGGGLGSVATINLFEDVNALEALKAEKDSWLFNEANLTFFVDKQIVEQYGLTLPERLYLYNANTNAAITDFLQDGTSTQSQSKLIYGGFLLEDDEKQYYKIRITDHLRNIVTKDSTNAPLRLAVADVFATQSPVAMANANNTTHYKIPARTISTPKSAVFVGPNPTDPALLDLKLQLEVFYTDVE